MLHQKILRLSLSAEIDLLMSLRTLFLLAIAGTTLLFASSCVRDYTCTCQIVYTGQTGLPDTLVREYNIKDTKKNAKSVCEGNSTTSDNNGIHTEEECHLY